jgi:hypothetical protein
VRPPDDGVAFATKGERTMKYSELIHGTIIHICIGELLSFIAAHMRFNVCYVQSDRGGQRLGSVRIRNQDSWIYDHDLCIIGWMDGCMEWSE